MQSRRNLLKTVPIVALSCAFPIRSAKSAVIELSVKHRANELADALHEANGGIWKISIDGAGEFVLISKVL